MYQFNQLIALFLVGLLLSGCFHSNDSNSCKKTVAPIESVQEEPSQNFTLPSESTLEDIYFDFILPDEYTICVQTSNTVSIVRNDLIVGGIIVTDLHAECLLEKNCTHLREYLTDLAAAPMYVEYLSMLFEDRAYISVAITDPEANTRAEQSHTLFEKDSVWFDIWVDKALVNEEERDILLNAIKP